MKNSSVSRKKVILKIKAEINAKETKEIIAKINKARSWFFERINKINKPQPDSSRNKERKIKSVKLEMKMERPNNRQHRNTKDHKRLLSAVICQ